MGAVGAWCRRTSQLLQLWIVHLCCSLAERDVTCRAGSVYLGDSSSATAAAATVSVVCDCAWQALNSCRDDAALATLPDAADYSGQETVLLTALVAAM